MFTFEILLAMAILVAALVVFALELFPIDFVAFSIVALVLLVGPVFGLGPEDAISGFSNPATITVLAMFILSGAIYRTGAISLLTRKVLRFSGQSELSQLALIMIVVGPISMFINNTAAVAILIPVVIAVAREHRTSPSKLLMPLSFTSQLAGIITLIGTSTNILASSLLIGSGLEGFGMFEFAKVGALVLATGALYLFTIGRFLMPERRSISDVATDYQVSKFLTEVIVLEDSPLIGKTLVQAQLGRKLDIDVLEISREKQKVGFLFSDTVLQAGDVLLLKANREELLKIKDEEGLALEPEMRFKDAEAQEEPIGLLEVIIGPNSHLIGGTLETSNFRNHFNCTVIAMRKQGRMISSLMRRERLTFGDTLLLQGEQSALDQVKREPGFIVTEEIKPENFNVEKIPIALGIMAGVVICAALGLTSILVTAMIGCVLMVVTGCLKVHELHESIRWDVIFLLAGVIPLGLIIESSGGAELIAGFAADSARLLHPLAVLFIFYFITMILTELISNNAAVVVMTPVGVAAAMALGVDYKAVVLAIMFAASTSFSTPVGYQTNTMIYGPGGYKFLDFLRVGGPLNLILAIVTPIYIYLVWGL